MRQENVGWIQDARQLLWERDGFSLPPCPATGHKPLTRSKQDAELDWLRRRIT
jgi:hypothetical protein